MHYTARFTTRALLQLEFLSQFDDMAQPLAALVAVARGWELYGPIALDRFYEAREMVDQGRFHCGTGHTIVRVRMVATLSIDETRSELQICDIERE